MVFDSKNIRPACALCEYGSILDDDTVLCRRKGPMGAADSCRRFRYDPLMRKPSPPPKLKEFTEEDFKL